MTSKTLRSALLGLSYAAFICCLMAGPVNAQATADIKTTATTEVRQGGGDIMPAMGAGTSSTSPKEYTVAPGEETHPPLRLSPDKSEMVRLDEDAGSIIVGNPAHVNVMLNSPRMLLLAPRQPGATQFTVLNNQGKVIMQRHVIVSGPQEKYIRIRRRCNSTSGAGCQDMSVYYCPGLCHDIQIGAGQGQTSPSGNVSASSDGESERTGGPVEDGSSNFEDDSDMSMEGTDDSVDSSSDDSSSDDSSSE